MRYRIAWFQGDVENPEPQDELAPAPSLCMDEIMADAEGAQLYTPSLRILLVPARPGALRHLSGDDWNDAPANCNASEPYDAPIGAKWITLKLGDEWPARDTLTGSSDE